VFKLLQLEQATLADLIVEGFVVIVVSLNPITNAKRGSIGDRFFFGYTP